MSGVHATFFSSKTMGKTGIEAIENAELLPASTLCLVCFLWAGYLYTRLDNMNSIYIGVLGSLILGLFGIILTLFRWNRFEYVNQGDSKQGPGFKRKRTLTSSAAQNQNPSI